MGEGEIFIRLSDSIILEHSALGTLKCISPRGSSSYYHCKSQAKGKRRRRSKAPRRFEEENSRGRSSRCYYKSAISNSHWAHRWGSCETSRGNRWEECKVSNFTSNLIESIDFPHISECRSRLQFQNRWEKRLTTRQMKQRKESLNQMRETVAIWKTTNGLKVFKKSRCVEKLN